MCRVIWGNWVGCLGFNGPLRQYWGNWDSKIGPRSSCSIGHCSWTIIILVVHLCFYRCFFFFLTFA